MNKNTEYLNNDYANVIKFMNIKSITSGQHKKVERQKNSFPKELVENVDLYKRLLNKIMTAHK